ncbi:MAG: hypothetical protein P8X49_13750 [Syntrophobacterales bacterium]
MIKGRNICPSWGLYNGSLRTVIDIVFQEGENPNDGDLPLYVLLEFDHYNGENVFCSDHPKVSKKPVFQTSQKIEIFNIQISLLAKDNFKSSIMQTMVSWYQYQPCK